MAAIETQITTADDESEVLCLFPVLLCIAFFPSSVPIILIGREGWLLYFVYPVFCFCYCSYGALGCSAVYDGGIS